MDTYLDHEILDLNVHEKKHKLNMCYTSLLSLSEISLVHEWNLHKITTDVWNIDISSHLSIMHALLFKFELLSTAIWQSPLS